ncbi:MAG: hypothetical protein U0Q20_06990 [Mycobacterium sp.]|nr:hypothetical protein [Mycobacterium sp.]
MTALRHLLSLTVTPCLATALATAPAALADPQSSSLCPEGALTSVPDGRLQCRAGQWLPSTNVNPAAGQWLTYGPPLTLSGTGRRNPEIASGSWIGRPQEPRSRCRAEQVPLAGQPQSQPPAVTTGDPGQPLSMQVPPTLYSITLSGDCLWQRVR